MCFERYIPQHWVSTFSYDFYKKKFDRHEVWNGSNSHQLARCYLRTPGATRLRKWSLRFNDDPRCPYDKAIYYCSSRSLLDIIFRPSEKGIYLDLGCGNSADAYIMKERGHYAFGLDLFPPDKVSRCTEWALSPPPFIQSDLCERIPFESNSVSSASCSAVIDCMTPDDRLLFYREVFRVLKKGGLFSISMQKLKCGHGFREKEESAKIQSAGFRRFGCYIKP